MLGIDSFCEIAYLCDRVVVLSPKERTQGKQKYNIEQGFAFAGALFTGF